MVALVIIMPVYLVSAFFYSQRRSAEFARHIDGLNNPGLAEAMKKFNPVILTLCSLLGLFYALVFNIPGNGLNILEIDPTERAVMIGQILIWTLLGGFLYLRIHVARQFCAAGARAQVDIFEPSNLRPFAQTGLIDVLIIVAGMVLSGVQALDFSFRPDNYSKALVIVAPAIVFLAIYPMWGLHKKMHAMRQTQLDELNGLIGAASKSLSDEAVIQLEALLQRRERVIAAPTWPVDIAIMQRFLFYIVLPPLAWVGAAMVENFINDLLSQG